LNRSLLESLFFFLIVNLGFTAPVTVHADSKTIERTRTLLSQLKSQTDASVFSRIAKEMGPIIDETRATKIDTPKLKILRELIESMRMHTQQRVKYMESGIQEDEAALERLYRSQSWDDLSFSQAAFAYWRAWIDLELARRVNNASAKNLALLPARQGFRVASMQLFRPDLMYGAWLGIGYVEMEQGHLDRAREIFIKLEEALSLAPESSIREAVSIEVRLLNIRTGNVNLSPASRQIDDHEAKMLRIEAFALLDDARKTGSHPEGVAQRFYALINSGRMDQSLLNNMMSYTQEIAAINLGAWTDLAAAELRLRHKDYNKAVQKFDTFFKKVVVPKGVNVDNYRYRWAVAHYKANHYQAAMNILEKLVRKKHLDSEIKKAATKLLFVAAAAREGKGSSSANRSSLRAAAQRFISMNPNDRDSDSARLILAQTSSDANVALKSLAQIKTKSKLRGDVERTAYQIITTEFRTKIAQGKIEMAKGLARDGIKAFQKLPETDRTDTKNMALLTQMRALVDPHPGKILSSLDSLDKQGNSDRDIHLALLWSRLQLYSRLGESSKLVELITRLSAKSIPSWEMAVVYPWIAQQENAELRLELARLAHPSAKTDSDMDRRFRGLIIESLIETENNTDAYENAMSFSQTYRNSGDAWRLLGRTAELANKPFEADKAWSVITESALPTTEIWWQGMLNRVRIRAGSTRPKQACPLLQELKSRTKYLPATYKTEYQSVLNTSEC
jgi:hypothetical protein